MWFEQEEAQRQLKNISVAKISRVSRKKEAYYHIDRLVIATMTQLIISYKR